MDTSHRACTHVPESQGETLQLTSGMATCKLSGQQTGSRYSLWGNVTPTGRGPRPHMHHGQEEDFYILEGEVQFQSDGETLSVKEGGFVRVPSGTVHSLTVTSDRPCRMLIMLTPSGGPEEFWRESAYR